MIQELARGLTPVRPVPRLRWVTLAVIGLWAATSWVAAAWLGFELRTEGTLRTGLLAIYAGLGVSGVAGVAAALAASIPGREALCRNALGVAAGALALAAGVATGVLWDSPLVNAPAPDATALRCLALACAVAALPAVAVIGFGAWTHTFRPLVVVLAAAAGTAALGGIAAKTSCPYGDLRHLVLGHLLAPAAGALLLTLPLFLALHRLRLRRDPERL
ncbi:MAG: hypothetical protein ABFS41_09195 [Myxococcota bacterium]